MDECRHGLIAAVCAVCCRAEAEAEQASASPVADRVLTGAGTSGR